MLVRSLISAGSCALVGLLAAACAQGVVTVDDFQGDGGGGSAGAAGGPSCAVQGLSDCDGVCADLATDSEHCGACTIACIQGMVCQNSHCGGCPQGETDCGGSCANLASDPNHCGNCAHACDPGQTCSLGACHCPSGLTDCPGGCLDTLHDANHCGGCNIVCDPGELCVQGFCTIDCGALTNCGGSCVDTSADDANCGGCFLPCGPGEHCAQSSCQCNGGMCSVCSVTDLGSSVPQSVSGSNVGTADSITPSCGASGGSDVSYTFTAPETGTYLFDTFGSSFDTIVHVHDASCGELACNDDTQGLQSQVTVALNQGDVVLVVVDGYSSATGSFTLHVSELPPCPESDIGSTVPQSVSGNDPGGSGLYSGSCGGAGAEQSFAFTAPAAGTYVFDTVGSSFDTVLYVHDAVCGGSERGCDDDSGGAGSSLLALDLGAGESVVVFVDPQSSADSGPFDLHVSQAPACPGSDLGSTVPQSVNGSTAGALPLRAGSCGGAGPEQVFSFTAPSAGEYVFDTIGSAVDTVLYLRAASCAGSELACDDNGGGGTSSLIVTALAAGQTVEVFVDGATLADAGSFVLHVALTPPCPEHDLGSVVPQTVSDTTALGAALRSGSCGGAGSPEASFVFTAPAAGAYSFDTVGSSFDTVLYVRDASCQGAELACNDDGPGIGTASQAALQLGAGQAVALFVDGKGASGPFNLSVKLGCPETDVGSTYPQTLSGTTLGEPNLFTPSCGFSSAPEHSFVFVAPTTGSYVFDTFGSTFDTVLHLRDGGCNDAELGCNDDTNGLQSQVAANLVAGQQVVVFVDGYSSNSGPYTFHITGP